MKCFSSWKNLSSPALLAVITAGLSVGTAHAEGDELGYRKKVEIGLYNSATVTSVGHSDTGGLGIHMSLGNFTQSDRRHRLIMDGKVLDVSFALGSGSTPGHRAEGIQADGTLARASVVQVLGKGNCGYTLGGAGGAAEMKLSTRNNGTTYASGSGIGFGRVQAGYACLDTAGLAFALHPFIGLSGMMDPEADILAAASLGGQAMIIGKDKALIIEAEHKKAFNSPLAQTSLKVEGRAQLGQNFYVGLKGEAYIDTGVKKSAEIPDGSVAAASLSATAGVAF